MLHSGSSLETARAMFDQLVTGQGVMLATNQLLLILALILLLAACTIWLAPKPARSVDTSSVH